MKKISREELDEIVENHRKYLNLIPGGKLGSITDTDLSGMDLSDMSLNGMVFTGSDFSGSLMRRTSFKGAQLQKVKMESVHMVEVDMMGVSMEESYVAHSLFDATNFSKAALRGVDLRLARIRNNTCFAGATGVPVFQVSNLGKSGESMTLLAYGDASSQWRWYVGDFTFREDALRARITGMYGRDSDFWDAINYLRKIAKRNAYRFTPTQVV